MNNRQKEIVIGEQYIYDVLCETNLAATTSLVTVVRETQKENTYTVLSVNTGDVFDCNAKYLTPYISPDKAVAIRCIYGVTEFDAVDQNTCNSVIPKLLDLLCTYKKSLPEKEADIVFCKDKETGNDILDLGIKCLCELSCKVLKYVELSKQRMVIKKNIMDRLKVQNDINNIISKGPFFPYMSLFETQNNINRLHAENGIPPLMFGYPTPPPTYNPTTATVIPPDDKLPVVPDKYLPPIMRSNKGPNPNMEQKRVEALIAQKEHEFNQMVGPVISKFVKEEIDEDEFIKMSKHIMTKYFPRESFITGYGPVSRERVYDQMFEYIDNSKDGDYIFFLGAPNGNIEVPPYITIITPDDIDEAMANEDGGNTSNKVIDFVFTIYPPKKGVPDDMLINANHTFAALVLHSHQKDDWSDELSDDVRFDYENNIDMEDDEDD